MADGGILKFLKARFGGISEQEAKGRLAAKYAAYRRLVDANTAALDLMADMQAKATGEYVFDRAYVDDSFAKLGQLSTSVVQNLRELSNGGHKALEGALDRVEREANPSSREGPPPHAGPMVVDLASAGGASLDLVGGKVHKLGEIMTDAGLPVPDGFCVTTAACLLYLQQGDLLPALSEEIKKISLRDKEELSRASRAIKDRVLLARWPEAPARAIMEAYSSLERRSGANVRVSVRSSAVGEDGEFSFAGQFDSALNVGREDLLQACQRVLASLFSPRALVYLRARGLGAEVLPMAIGVIVMVDARASGVLYTRDPQNPGMDAMTVAGLWGLGVLTVDGSSTPDVFTLSGRPDPVVREANVSTKDRMLLCGEGPGVVEVDVPKWMKDQPCLTKDQLAELGAFGHRLERHFGKPQDVEWALDPRDNLYVLQSRPLRLPAPAEPPENAMALRKSLKVLLHQGVVACRGIAAGPVSLIESDEDVHLIPYGAVLVAGAASPKLAEAVDRIVALVTDQGSAASHLATVAREFNIPAILSTRSATSVLKPGMIVTVDGDMGSVYEGRAESLLAGARRGSSEGEATPLLRKFRASLAHVTPLNLTDPRSPGFRASKCKTVHDILRFAHEEAVREMFRAGSLASKGTKYALRLESPLPVDFFFIDLGGGLKAERSSRLVTPADFLCRPLVPLWQGMVQVPWRTDAAAGARAMASVFSSTLTAGDAMRNAAEPNLVIVSDAYLNLAFRLGYHFSRVDAYIGDRPEENYASFLFQGGAADARGKSRRVRFVAAALERSGFRVHVREDALFSRTDQQSPDEMALRLAVLGRLMVVTRQADTLFEDDAAVARALDAFEAGDFSLGLGWQEENPS